jgi:hypothetical protein
VPQMILNQQKWIQILLQLGKEHAADALNPTVERELWR